MKAEVTDQHRWLQKLLGEWRYEHDAPAKADKPAKKIAGIEHVRMLGDVWVLCEAKVTMPDGTTAQSLMTLGYDPQKQRFVGTWIGSMMNHLWVYDGELNEAGTALSLLALGPDFATPGKLAQYKDVIEFKSDDHRVLTAHALGEDGKWTEFTSAQYFRVK
jgi:hypothetical protein